MKIYIYCVLAVFLGLGLAGCEQQEVNRYENDPRLYFYNGRDYDHNPVFPQYDSTAQSFYLLPESQTRDTVYVVIETMGMTTDEPRPFRLVQTNIGDPDAAVAGTHYLSFDSEEMLKNMMMPVGCVHYYMPLIVLRDPSLNSSKVRLKMTIAENEYFKPGMERYINFMVTMTATAEKPKTWPANSIYGTWGPQKMWFLLNYVGVTDFSNPSDNGYRDYLKTLAIVKLNAYNADENNPDRPLKEADGTPVNF